MMRLRLLTSLVLLTPSGLAGCVAETGEPSSFTAEEDKFLEGQTWTCRLSTRGGWLQEQGDETIDFLPEPGWTTAVDFRRAYQPGPRGNDDVELVEQRTFFGMNPLHPLQRPEWLERDHNMFYRPEQWGSSRYSTAADYMFDPFRVIEGDGDVARFPTVLRSFPAFLPAGRTHRRFAVELDSELAGRLVGLGHRPTYFGPSTDNPRETGMAGPTEVYADWTGRRTFPWGVNHNELQVHYYDDDGGWGWYFRYKATCGVPTRF